MAEKYVGEDAAEAVDGVVDEGFKQLNIDENLAGLGGTEMESVMQVRNNKMRNDKRGR